MGVPRKYLITSNEFKIGIRKEQGKIVRRNFKNGTSLEDYSKYTSLINFEVALKENDLKVHA